MNVYVIMHYHRHGTDAWPWYSDVMPTEDEVIDTSLKELWEGDERDDEWIEIIGPWELPESDKDMGEAQPC